jgi:hypothetical protein
MAEHPVTVLNPEKVFEVHEVDFRNGRFYVRGENTMWFGVGLVKPVDGETYEMVRELPRYPNIEAAAVCMSLDCGGINAFRTEENMLNALRELLGAMTVQHQHRYYFQHVEYLHIDSYLGELSQRDLETVCTGDIEEAGRILSTAPEKTINLLHAIFEEIA